MNMGDDAVVYIRFPGNMDVVYGRGGLANNHDGNKVFRELIMSNKERYESIEDRALKNEIASSIVSQMRAKGGRFLQYSESAQLWYDSGDVKAVEKTKQRFRELREPRVRNKTASQEAQRSKEFKKPGNKGQGSDVVDIPEKSASIATAPRKSASKPIPRVPGNTNASALPHQGIVGLKPSAIQSLKDRKSVAACNSSVTASELDEEFRKLEEARSRMRSLLSSRVKEEDHRLAASYLPPLVRHQHQSSSGAPYLHHHHSGLSMQERLARLYAANPNTNIPYGEAPVPTPQLGNLALRRSMMNNLVGIPLDGRTAMSSVAMRTPIAPHIASLYDSAVPVRRPPPGNDNADVLATRPGMNAVSLLPTIRAENEEAATWPAKNTGGQPDRLHLADDLRRVPPTVGQLPDSPTTFSNPSSSRSQNLVTVHDSHLSAGDAAPTAGLPSWREQERFGSAASDRHEAGTTRTTPTTDGDDSQDVDGMQNNNSSSGGARTGYSKTSCGSSMDMSSLFSELSEQCPGIDKLEHRLSHITVQDLESETVASSDEKASMQQLQRRGPPSNRSKRSVVVETVDVVFKGNEEERERAGGGVGDNDSARSVLTMSDLGTADLMLDDDGTSTVTGRQQQQSHQYQHRMGGYYRSESGRSLMSDSCFSSVSVGLDEATTMSQGC